MSGHIEKIKCTKGTIIIGNDSTNGADENPFLLDIPLGLSSLAKKEPDDYLQMKQIEKSEQQKYPNILTSLSKSQNRGVQLNRTINTNIFSKNMNQNQSSNLNFKRSDQQISVSMRITKKVPKEQQVSQKSPTGQSFVSTQSQSCNSGENTNKSKQDKENSLFQQPLTLPFLKYNSAGQEAPVQRANQNKQTKNTSLQRGKDEKKEFKNREKRIISNKAIKSQMSITTLIHNSMSTLYITPLFKVQFTYIVEKGNNSQIVKRILNKRDWWAEAQNSYSSYHFRWKPTSSGIKFDDIMFTPSKKQMVNHIENHVEISCKSKLYNNLKNSHKNEIDQLVPKTFLLNIESENYERDIQNFVDYFFNLQQSTKLKNIWILKPDDLNRGQGISLFSTVSQLFTLLLSYGKIELLKQIFIKICPQVVEKYEQQQKSQDMLKEIDIKQFQSEAIEKAYRKPRLQVSNLNQTPKVIVLQKYIEEPLLIKDRKFDIRVWVLVDQDFKFYMFKEGYLRLSSEKFSLRSHTLQDKYVHLTNNAIQKYGKNYGKYENGNIISFDDYGEYLKNKNMPFTVEDTLKQIKNLIKVSFSSVRRKLYRKDRKNTFEIFGYDFMVESNGNTQLIEINSNPCIEESNELLQKLIPRMLNDAFRITIDRVFCSNKMFTSCFNDYAIEGYSNFENLWEYLGSLQPQTQNLIVIGKEASQSVFETPQQQQQHQ
ncbi:tubulin-tyrosine ligase family protein (macronuclear) [Tetrahymena thermophila SB210]|uniref:Tubulin-tyrosine ligase family protein n=1 Tax=Tetrahymena thermophila (strain SB210) TaxID=312017 RepID=I7MDB1_TETTS|nr:tubulin-tyrosine ligase family protein [Tetrahymena thermophila SB210]EAR86113.2 tubulin-tyrosine ligase family protein [Tetrahymena thermophila SB210]|eukprot:XP_976708.2 tubulin-tyrosine ligase family protein [Tetrahymena thermophila SB210]